MIMTNFLQKRRTVRDFKANELSASTLIMIKELLERVEAEEENLVLKFALYENGEIIAKALDGKAGYGGVMIHAPHYISLQMKSSEEADLIRTGYYLEKVNTFLVEKDLGTCWITVDEVDAATKKTIFGEGGEEVFFLIAIGEAKGKKLFEENKVTPRFGFDKLVFSDSIGNPASIDDLEQRGLLDVFTSVRFAPSHMNSQPWRFLIKDEKVVLYMVRSDWDHRSFVDIGVMMFYFEEMAKTLGKHGKWTIIEEADIDGLKPVAEFVL